MRHFATVVLCGTLASQGPIYVVDASNGPGTHYTQIQAAVVAVPDGSTLVVRPGSYAAVTIDAKALTILAAPGVTVGTALPPGPSLWIRNTVPAQTVTVRGLQDAGSSGVPVRVDNAAGPVTIDGAGGQLASGGNGSPALAITASSQLTVRDWRLLGRSLSAACTVANSSVVFERCTLRGANGGFISKAGGFHAEPGMQASASQVQLVQSDVFGGNGAQFVWMGNPSYVQAAPAIVLSSSSLRALGESNNSITGGTTPPATQFPGVGGNGVARVVPQMVLSAAPSPGVLLTRPEMPSLLATSAVPGGTMTVERHGPAGVLTAVAISLRAPASSLPPLPDPVWLDGASVVVEAAGVTAISPFVVTKLVPSVPALVGFQCVWQAADLDATGLLAVSNPSPSFVR